MASPELHHHPGLPGAAYRSEFAFGLMSFALPGFLATMLIAVGALGVGWLPLDTEIVDLGVVETMRTTTAGMWLSRLMVLVGVGLLLQTWLVMGSDLMSGLRLSFKTQSAVLFAWAAPLLLAPPLFSRDVYAYLAQGRLISEGIDPYGDGGVSQLPGWFVEGVDPMWGETPAPYGPLWLMTSSWIADFADNYVYLAVLLFRLLAVAGVIGMLWLVPRLAEQHGIDPGKAVWLAVLNPLVIMHFVAGGHNDSLMVAFLLAAFWFAGRNQIAAGAAMVALATSVKPIAFVALPFIGIAKRPRDWTWPQRIWDWIYVSLIAGGVFLVTALVANLGFGWLTALGTPGEVKTWLSPMTAIGMTAGGVFQWLDLAETNEVAVQVFRSIGLLISGALVTYLALKPQGRSPARDAGLALLVIVALGPVVQPWYLLWILPLLVATGLREWQLRATIIVTAAMTIHAMVDGSATSDGLFDLSSGLAVVFAFVLVIGVLVASPRERRLVFAKNGTAGLLPDTPERREAAESRIIGPPRAEADPKESLPV